MPLQNRVTPFGDIVVDPSRGTMMGNRGILHGDGQQLGRSRWRHKNWVACVLQFKGRQRPLMTPGHYTELFFLDEATALAAGHRPCAECRRADFLRFRDAFMKGNRHTEPPSAPQIDAALHRHRVTRPGLRVTFEAPDRSLPDGTMISVEGKAWLVWRGIRHEWGFDGYGDSRKLDGSTVTVLTPLPTVEALRAGYVAGVLGLGDGGISRTRPSRETPDGRWLP